MTLRAQNLSHQVILLILDRRDIEKTTSGSLMSYYLLTPVPRYPRRINNIVSLKHHVDTFDSVQPSFFFHFVGNGHFKCQLAHKSLDARSKATYFSSTRSIDVPITDTCSLPSFIVAMASTPALNASMIPSAR